MLNPRSLLIPLVSEIEVKESKITLHTAGRVYQLLALNTAIAKEWETALLPYTGDPRVSFSFHCSAND